MSKEIRIISLKNSPVIITIVLVICALTGSILRKERQELAEEQGRIVVVEGGSSSEDADLFFFNKEEGESAFQEGSSSLCGCGTTANSEQSGGVPQKPFYVSLTHQTPCFLEMVNKQGKPISVSDVCNNDDASCLQKFNEIRNLISKKYLYAGEIPNGGVESMMTLEDIEEIASFYQQVNKQIPGFYLLLKEDTINQIIIFDLLIKPIADFDPETQAARPDVILTLYPGPRIAPICYDEVRDHCKEDSQVELALTQGCKFSYIDQAESRNQKTNVIKFNFEVKQ